MIGLELLPLQQSWLPELMQIEREAFGEDAWTQEMFRQGMQQPLAHYIVAKRQDMLVGYMGFLHVIDEVELLTIAVSSSARRMGIGKCLLLELLSYVKWHNVNRVLLEVRQSNFAAIALYESLAFHPIGIRKGYYHNPQEDALIYEWTGGAQRVGNTSV